MHYYKTIRANLPQLKFASQRNLDQPTKQNSVDRFLQTRHHKNGGANWGYQDLYAMKEMTMTGQHFASHEKLVKPAMLVD